MPRAASLSPKRRPTKKAASGVSRARSTRAKRVVEEEVPIVVNSVMEAETETYVAEPQVVREQRYEGAQKPEARVITMQTVEPSALGSMNVETRRMMLWMGVSVTMFFIVLAWTFSLGPQLAVPSLASNESDVLGKMNDDFANMYVDVNRRLDALKAQTPAPTTAASEPTTTTSSELASPALSPQEIEALKAKVLGAETDADSSTPTTP